MFDMFGVVGMFETFGIKIQLNLQDFQLNKTIWMYMGGTHPIWQMRFFPISKFRFASYHLLVTRISISGYQAASRGKIGLTQILIVTLRIQKSSDHQATAMILQTFVPHRL